MTNVVDLDFSRCRLPPFQHQREDVAWLLERPYALIASEMRTGKTKIVIDAAQFLFERGKIDRVIVVAPAPVRDVWFDQTLGELAKHLWIDLPARIVEFHARFRMWEHGPSTVTKFERLEWFVTNYEFLRNKARLAQLQATCGPKTLLVLDESSYVKNAAAQQTKACVALRKKCGRIVLLNGTPIFHSPLDLFSQGNILHPSVLDCKFVTLFKARYAVQEPVLGFGGKPLMNPYGGAVQKITGWTNLDDLQRRFAPVTVRRLQKDCLDLPPKLDPVMLTATLTPETWRAYKTMRNELVVWLKDGKVATSATAAIKALRLSQITSGFLGGVEEAGVDDRIEDGLLESIDLSGLVPPTNDEVDALLTASLGPNKPIEFGVDFGNHPRGITAIVDASGHILADMEGDTDLEQTVDEYLGGAKRYVQTTREIGREKLDVLLWFIGQRLEADPNLHLVAWCRFRAEVFRMADAVTKAYPQFAVATIVGGQKKADRLRALSLLNPETTPSGPVFVAGIEGTGSFGLNFTAAHTCVTVSSGYSPGRSAQTLDRVYGPGQTQPIAYFDIVAVGPKGQRTIDHQIIAARRAGEDIATWTSAAWIKALMEE